MESRLGNYIGGSINAETWNIQLTKKVIQIFL